MSKKIEKIIDNFLFQYEGNGCECVEDIIHQAPGEEPERIYKIRSIQDRQRRFAYAAGMGLVRMAPNGTIEEKNVLGSLISLPTKKDKDFRKFVNDNGFIFPVDTESYESFDFKSVYSLINRLRITVELMTAANEIRKDYMKIFHLLLKLLLAEDASVKTDPMDSAYHSNHHDFIDLLNNASPALSPSRSQEAFDSDYFLVNDTIYGKYKYNVNHFNDIVEGNSPVPSERDSLFRDVVMLYINLEIPAEYRLITDLILHYFERVGVISPANNWNYYGTPKKENIDEPMEKALIEVSNQIVAEEINANLSGIHPVYDPDRMMPSWKVDNLLTAAYFSIFYLNPNLEIYRQCANPRCKKYFLVKTTSTRKRYCSTECCNRVTQDTYRKKRRSQRESK